MKPHEYPRRILLAVTGLSPQVVTETLFALARKQTPAFEPTEIRVITTRQGAEHAALNLLSQQIGWFHRLRADYALPEIAFDADHIHVIPDEAGGALDDIRTLADNARAADFITDHVRKLTAEPDCALHVSIAGGRKTMGYYLGYALALFGREQDRLSHVLVSAPYENNRDFYYPTPYEHAIHVMQNGKDVAFDCRKAEITLAEIPFVRLRHELPERLLKKPVRYSEAVAAAQNKLGAELVIDLKGQRIRAGGKVVGLSPAELAFLSWFARHQLAGGAPLPALSEKDKDGLGKKYRDAYLNEYRRIDPFADSGRIAKRLRYGMERQYFDERKSKLTAALKDVLGMAAGPYLLEGIGRRPRRYRLPLDSAAIRYEAIATASLSSTRASARVGTAHKSKQRGIAGGAPRQARQR